MEYVPRLIESQISTYLNTPSNSMLLVSGAPQVGKTRMIEHALEAAKPKRISFSLRVHSHFRAQIDACSGFNQFRKLLEDEYRFDPNQGTILFIDDIQECPVLATFIPRMRDAWRKCPIVLCGSLLSEHYDDVLSEPPTRITHLTVRPYQFSEFLKANQKGSLSRHVERGKTAIFEDRHSRLLEWLERFLEVGGLPEVVDWASHGEDFSFHLDEIITGLGNQIASGHSAVNVETVNDALRFLAEQSLSGLPPDLLRTLKRWDLILDITPSQKEHILFDLGISRQYTLGEPASFWDAESGDTDMLTQLEQTIRKQTAVSLQFQGASVLPEPPPATDFLLEGSSPIPIVCKPLFELSPEAIEDGFSMMAAVQSDLGAIVGLTPFETVERDGKRLLSVPLYLIEALLDIVSRPG